MIKIGEIQRQGNVYVKRVERIPDGGVSLTHVAHVTLAVGKGTIHVHEITEGQGEIIDIKGTWYLRVTSETATLVYLSARQGYGNLTLSQGEYQIGFEQDTRPQDGVVPVTNRVAHLARLADHRIAQSHD